MADPALADPASPAESVEDRVVAVVRGLAREMGGARAEQAVSPGASLERDIGLGSLERVELIARLEKAFRQRLDEQFLRIDTPGEIAIALSETETSNDTGVPRAVRVAAAALQTRSAATLHEALWRRTEQHPERPQTFMREDDGREHTIRYVDLLEAARSVAGGLRERGVARGDTVALMLPTGFDFLQSFQGILIAGAIPVPIYPPLRLDRLAEYAERQSAILADAGIVAMITIPRAKPIAELLRPRVPSLRQVVTADELQQSGLRFDAPEGRGEDPAFIQYTSGSTGHPKGVLLTHANLLANVKAIAAGTEARPTDVGVSWLPLYHDMGLIGSWLFCLVNGFPIDIQSPLSFLARPERWLWAIHRRRGTLSAGPNFAYELCVRRIEDSAIEGLDLSSWRCAFNGAEPVSPDTLDRFAKRFARYGLRREALFPVYGLAESSVALAFPPIGRGPLIDRVKRDAFERDARAERAPDDDATALRFVSIGRALPEHEIRIVDDQGDTVAERSVGRLAFRGPSMMSGYFNQPEATRAITLPGGLFDSGDLAYQAGGEIFICGRKKDLIIKAGRNYVPQEIEEAAGLAAGVRKGCVVAFGVVSESSGTESLVVVAETRATEPGERDRIASEITEKVGAAIGVPPDAVALVPPGAVPKTSSGKIRRAATKQSYAKGDLGKAPATPWLTRARLVGAVLLQEARPRLVQLLRHGYAAYLIAALALPLAAAWLLGLILPAGRATRGVERVLFKLVLRLAGCPLSVTGAVHLASDRPLILACNHASYADIAALLALLPSQFVFVAKREALRWPLVGLFLRKSGHVGVERFDAKEGASDAAKLGEAISLGRSVVVFPEGTFTRTTGLRPFRLGAFKTAVETGTPVVPVAIRGARAVLRDKTWIPRPGPIAFEIGAPIAPAGSEWRDVVALRDQVADYVAERCGEPRLDIVAGGPERPN